MIQERSSTLSAAGLVGPATLYVAVGLLIPLAILFRYSLNQFVPGKFMVDALTIENYVKFFTDVYYTAVLTRTVRIALWTGEEQGLLGSKAYVKEHFADRETMSLKPEHAKLSGYFNLDNGTGKIRGVYLQDNDMMRPYQVG